MSPDPTSRPVHRRIGLPTHTIQHGVAPDANQPDQKSSPSAPGDALDAAAEEPVPHEHLPPRSDDN